MCAVFRQNIARYLPAALALLLGVALLGFLPAARAADSLSLQTLMSALAQVKTADAQFKELRYMAMLTQPIESSGTLRYVAPDRLERNITAPKPLRMIVEGRKVTVEEAPGRVRTLSLDESAELAALIESIRGALSGDQEALERYFALSVQGTAESWQLLMLPKTTQIQAVVDSIRMAGAGDEIHTVETVEHGGDRTVMTITRTAP